MFYTIADNKNKKETNLRIASASSITIGLVREKEP